MGIGENVEGAQEEGETRGVRGMETSWGWGAPVGEAEDGTATDECHMCWDLASVIPISL